MKTLIALATIALFSAPLAAATPPDRINYQGVLRDGSGAPSTGSFDMTFHLFASDIGSNEILLDRHLAANAQAVVVTNGLFNVEIGSGQMLDGSGPGAFTTLAAAFGAQGDLWMAIEIAGETLAPRLHLAAAGYALNAGALDGKAAASFLDIGATSQTKSGQINLSGASVPSGQAALNSTGEVGGSFSSTSGGHADLGYYTYGVNASGPDYGGLFTGTIGVQALGTTAGGYFQNQNSPGWAYLGYGTWGIHASGNPAGVFWNSQGLSQVSLAEMFAGVDVSVRGSSAAATMTDGGYFEVKDQSGLTTLATARLAHTWTYDCCSGPPHPDAAVFENFPRHTHVRIGSDDGLGVFAKTDGSPGAAFISIPGESWGVLWGQFGVSAEGQDAGGYFEDHDSFGWAYVASGSYKIQGSGSVAFTQNHPTDKDKVIVYNSPEGDEVATYTRGSARLIGGEARVPLGETFAWVTNPDLGLTAYVTPVGEWADLYVASKTTKELVVRSREPGQGPVTFDYIVYGLRIGFEETSIVQEKEQEAFIPSMADHRKLYADHPELRRYNALERVKGMRSLMGMEAGTDLSASTALRNAIHEYDPNTDASIPMQGRERLSRHGDVAATGDAQPAEPGLAHGSASESGTVARGSPAGTATTRPPGMSPGDVVIEPSSPAAERLLVSEPVRAGELLAIDPSSPDRVHRAEGIGDPRFVGVAAADSVGDEVALATTRIVRVLADASLGVIAPGDLLTTSAAPGLAMRAVAPAAGTVFGKALDPLAEGTGEIRVLWMPR